LNIAANEILEIGAERACDPLQQGISTMSVAVASGVNGAGDSWVASTRRINSNDRRESRISSSPMPRSAGASRA
jgi:hypothetical protein